MIQQKRTKCLLREVQGGEGGPLRKGMIKMSKLYLAYGSNLNVRQMKFRCPSAKIIGVGLIKNYQLMYKGSKTGSYLTIEKMKGSAVPVAVWEVTGFDERRLDSYEGATRS